MAPSGAATWAGRACAAVLVVLLASACGHGDTAGAPSGSARTVPAVSATPGVSSASGGTATGGSADQWYVSVGDSYAAGYQPVGEHGGATSTNGFAYQLVAVAKAKGYDLRLVNFGCSGATTVSATQEHGCPRADLGPGAPLYDEQTQAAATEEFVRSHAGHIALITVSLGGNDIVSCLRASDAAGCITQAVAQVGVYLGQLLRNLRAAAGSQVPIVGITYPDVALAGFVRNFGNSKQLAAASVSAFHDLLNPALSLVYKSVDAAFVDVTSATDAYVPLDRTVNVAPFGVIPVAVARLCEVTFACQYPDIHPRTAGYKLIADLVAATLPARRSGAAR